MVSSLVLVDWGTSAAEIARTGLPSVVIDQTRRQPCEFRGAFTNNPG